MRPKRNNLLNKPTADLKQETKKMEDKLNQLKAFMHKQKADREVANRFESKIKQKSMAHQMADVPEILEILKQVGLPQYYKSLIESGIDSAEVLRDATRENLEEIGVLKGHAIKILRFVKDKGQKTTPVMEPQLGLEHAGRIPSPNNLKPEIPSSEFQKPQSVFEGIQTEGPQRQRIPREFCKKCYKECLNPNPNSGGFCSQDCEQAYRLQNFGRCECCGTQREKWDLVKVEDSYFCNEKCLDSFIEALTVVEQKQTSLNEEEEEIFWRGEEQPSQLDSGQLQSLLSTLRLNR